MTEPDPSPSAATDGARRRSARPEGRAAARQARERAAREERRHARHEAQSPSTRGPLRQVLQGLWVIVREVGIVVGLAMLVSLVVKTFLLQPFHIPSGSMENTLFNGDRVVVSKLTPGPIGLERGDIIVFTDPDHWLGELPPPDRSRLHAALVFVGLAPDDSHEHLIKRVIGLPGDRVVCCDTDGRVTVNGTPLVETYVKPGDTPGGGRAPFSITVPADRVWVMGDHRSDSADSRLHDDGTGAKGSVPIDVIKGRAVLVVWPLDRWAWLSVPAAIYAGIPAPRG